MAVTLIVLPEHLWLSKENRRWCHGWQNVIQKK